ncbi:MAG: hypothetical protein NVSMB27_43680 [Ktedonobacteraceae bacterium]
MLTAELVTVVFDALHPTQLGEIGPFTARFDPTGVSAYPAKA